MAAPLPGSSDLTAVLIKRGTDGSAIDDAAIRSAVRGHGDGFLRIRDLPALGLTQVELLDGAGLPRVDPALVIALSRHRRAAFVHANHEAGQAIAHWFEDGKEIEGWVGAPDALDGKLASAIGCTRAALLAADDGTRRGFGRSASGTVALSRGRAVRLPVGVSTSLGSFGFHDRGDWGAPATEDRVALIAFDGAAARRAWESEPGRDLAARIAALPPSVAGPLSPLREPAAMALAALGDRPPAEAGLTSITAFELCALDTAFPFAAGESVAWLDGRMLPMFSLVETDAALDDDPDLAEELLAQPSVLAAMVETLPFHSPQGAVMEQIADEEMAPLAPWARPGEEYVGSLLSLRPDRLRGLLTSVEPVDVAARADRFYRAWWKAGHDQPIGASFDAWRRKLDEQGGADIQRFFTAWEEWRTVLRVAELNRLDTALVFYGSPDLPTGGEERRTDAP